MLSNHRAQFHADQLLRNQTDRDNKSNSKLYYTIRYDTKYGILYYVNDTNVWWVKELVESVARLAWSRA